MSCAHRRDFGFKNMALLGFDYCAAQNHETLSLLSALVTEHMTKLRFYWFRCCRGIH